MPSKQGNPPPIPYRAQWAAAVIVGLLIFAGTAAAAGATDLGLTRPQLVLLGIVVGCLGLVQSLLPRVFAVPSDKRTGMD